MHILAENRRALFDYEILETYEAGIALRGFETKSVKQGRMNLVGSYAVIRGGNALLIGADIPPYQTKNTPREYDPKATRKLLLHRNEIRHLAGKLHEKGLALIAIRAYLKKNLIKLELGLGRARKKSDKRELLKKRAAEREMQTSTSKHSST